MFILGIESSCDDTSVALVKADKNGFEVLSEKTASQIEIHKKYGGVVPEISGRLHAEKILPVVEEVMKNQPKPDVIAVTAGPGLITGLLVGMETAKTLSYLWDIPVVRMNHIEGHIYSTQISSSKKFEYPLLALVASGGHTELILSEKEGNYKLIGKTLDDAAGECFDKVAKMLKLNYPGGPKISKFATEGNPEAIKFPRPMLDKDNFDFSFSGLKTSALYWLRDNKISNTKNIFIKIMNQLGLFKNKVTLNDFCASFEQTVVDVITTKTLKAAKKYNPKTVVFGGGVSANKKLRETLETILKKEIPNSKFLIPNSVYSMDNAAMIAVASYHHALKKEFTPWQELIADPNWKIYE